MTVVVAYRFPEGAVVLADSRATRMGQRNTYQDTLQKVLPVGGKQAIAYSGDVGAAGLVVWELRRRIRSNSRLLIPHKLALEIPRVARHYYDVYRARHGVVHPLDLVLAGVSERGEVGVWWYQSPNFESHLLTDGCIALGSGAEAARKCLAKAASTFQTAPSLKAKADALISGLEQELIIEGTESVGGLFQVIVVQSDGVRPMRYGFVTLDPERAGQAKSISMSQGRWVQRDLSAKVEVPLQEPGKLVQEKGREFRFYDYLPRLDRGKPRWNLSYLLTCVEVDRNPESIEFRGSASAVGTAEFPASVPMLTAVAFWGSPGEHKVTINLLHGNEKREVLSRQIRIEYLPEDYELAESVLLEVGSPGPAFVEVHVDDQMLARRALYFHQVRAPDEGESEFEAFVRRVQREMLEGQRACRDPILEEGGKAALVYFSICKAAATDENTLRFEEQFGAVFWKNYPLKLRAVMPLAFRAQPGQHRVRLDLVDAITRESSTFDTATVDSTSSCIVTQIHGEVIMLIPKPGIYFINALVDELFIGSLLLFAETDKPEYSYRLREVDAERVRAGELLVLSKRSEEAR